MKIAVLLTTYNRRQKTLACLHSLRNQHLSKNIVVEVHLTDDNSQDGTAELVQLFFPDVNIYYGTGALYWAGGMRYTWKQALNTDAEYFLLLNDDTVLNENAISILIESIKISGKPAICIGSTIDNSTGKISYGGSKVKFRNIWSSASVHSNNKYLPCDFGNANIMFVPRAVVNFIGILSESYTHGLADYDYTLTAKKAGFNVLVAPGFLGICTDDHGNNWMPQTKTLKERIQYLKSVKGLAYKEYLLFIKNHFPLSLPSAFVKLWLKTFFPFLWQTFK